MREPETVLLLRNARIWAGPDASISAPQDVLLRDGRIAALGELTGDGIDLGGRVVTAGFWNSHVHFTEDVWSSASDARLQDALDDMILSRGFVGVVDLGSDPRTTKPLRERIAGGELRGPAILTAGAGIRPWNGMPYYLKASVPWYLRWAMPMPITAYGARRVVARQVRSGMDVVKLFTGSYVTPSRIKPMRPVVARAATAEAHRLGVRVLVHPSNHQGTQIALDAGVDALAHVPSETEGTAPLLEAAARRGIRVVPTLHMFKATVSSDAGYLEPLYDELRGFLAAGGRVMFGTDVGYMRDRDTTGEFEGMAASGMDAADILRSLTLEPAAFRGRAGGEVAVGMPADLTVLDVTGVPEPADFAHIHAVVREGRVVWQA